MTSKLYGHSQDLSKAMPLIREIRPGYWEVIGRQEDLQWYQECAALGVKLLFRQPRGDMDFNPGYIKNRVWSAIANSCAREFVWDCAQKPWFRYAWAILTPPGLVDDSIQGPDRVWATNFLKDCVEEFAARGKECVVGNWPHGNSGWEVPGAWYYGVQRYAWNHPISLGPLQWWNPAWGKLVITEVGYTRATIEYVPPGTDTAMGWKNESIPGIYQASLRTLDAMLRGEDDILGAFIFQVGGFDDWASFEVLGTAVESWLKEQHQSQKEEIVPTKPAMTTGVENALNVVWGWAQQIRSVSGFQAAHELEEAVRIMKEEFGPKV